MSWRAFLAWVSKVISAPSPLHAPDKRRGAQDAHDAACQLLRQLHGIGVRAIVRDERATLPGPDATDEPARPVSRACTIRQCRFS